MARRIPGKTIESRERQMVGLAVDLAEQQLKDGTASSAVITHYLKLGASDYRLHLEKLERENELLRAKAEAVESSRESKELAREALEAMRRYTGNYDNSIDEML